MLFLSDDLKEESFANFDQMNNSPWGESSAVTTSNIATSAETASCAAVTVETVQSPQWTADFSNDPFGSTESAHSVAAEVVATATAQVNAADFSTDLPNTSSPKEEEQQQQ